MQAIKPLLAATRTSSPAQSEASAQPAVRRDAVDTYSAGRSVRSDAALHAPPSFQVNGKTVVFGDIKKVDSTVVLDVASKKSTVKAVVEIELSEKGQPAIELVPRASKVVVDGKEVDPASYSDVRDPGNESNFRVLGVELEPGVHRIEVEYELTAGVRYSGDSVEFFARKSDLDNRSMDEQYFPTNLEYDQYPGSITFDIRGTQAEHRIMSNGEVSKVDGKLVVTFPAHYNTASLFLNVINPARFSISEDVFKSSTGAQIPITVYTPGNLVVGKLPERFGDGVGLKPPAPTVPNGDVPLSAEEAAHRGVELTKQALAKHEKDIAPYPHPRVLVRVSGSGGMEYSGATETSLNALQHELHHQWFARSAQPANGNAGWIDEALASWHDNGYPTSRSEPWSARKLSGFPAWHRITPQAAYSHGASVMAYLDSVFAPKGGLRPVLTKFFDAYTKKVFTTEQFLEFLKKEGEGLSFDFDALFKKQVYATGLHLMKKASKAD
ncbi:MAG: hypothetical protein ACAI38_21395 [Myxococcota bacterium]|nr:hypothetical protein [Myxococcota bacterium]